MGFNVPINLNLFNYYEAVSMLIFGIGFTALLLQNNLIKKVIALNLMDTGTYLFLAAKGYIQGCAAPIITDGIQQAEAYVNPVPAGLVLTGIVVSVSMTAFLLALTVRLFLRYHTLNFDEIIRLAKKEED